MFLENCAKFVFYSAKFIGLVASTYPPKKSHRNSSISAIDVVVANKWRNSAGRCNHRNRSSNNNKNNNPDATTPNNNCQLSCDGTRCRRSCNRNTRSRLHLISLLLLLLLVYPVVVLLVKSCAADNERTTSYFNLFVFITLYVHYVLMVVVCTMVVLRNRSGFTDALSRLNSLIQSICASMATTFADVGSPGNGLGLHRKEIWIRSRSIDLGLKCGLGITLVVLCWLNINLPILSATNWITILCSSLILILPTLLLVTLSATFYALAVVMEGLLFVLNSWLRDACMQLLVKRGNAAEERGGGRMRAHEGFRRNKLWQLSICDNVDIIIQYYSRTLQLLKQLNHFHAMPALLIILNCFFNIAVQSFSIYMALSAPDVTATDNGELYFIQDNNTNNNNSGHPLSVVGSPKESPQTVAHLYIIAVNAVYILINYCELLATIRASVGHRTAVSI